MKDKILVYDDYCPLCSWYSGLFVKFGFLPSDGRRPFSSLEPSLLNTIDLAQGRNEIPLIEPASGKVVYGIDALIEILGEKFHWIKRAGKIGFVKWWFRKLYWFISYNRKVVVAKKCGTGVIDCSPDLNYFYRYLFMGVFLLFNTLMLFPIHSVVLSNLPFYSHSIKDLQIAHMGLVLANCILSLLLSFQKRVEYLGQVNMLALITILLLLPLLIVCSFINPGQFIISGYIFFVALFVFKEFLRRMDYVGMLTGNKWILSANLLSISGFFLFLFK